MMMAMVIVVGGAVVIFLATLFLFHRWILAPPLAVVSGALLFVLPSSSLFVSCLLAASD